MMLLQEELEVLEGMAKRYEACQARLAEAERQLAEDAAEKTALHQELGPRPTYSHTSRRGL